MRGGTPPLSSGQKPLNHHFASALDSTICDCLSLAQCQNSDFLFSQKALTHLHVFFVLI